MHWIDANPNRDLIVVSIGLILAVAVAIYTAVKPYPKDYNAEGKLLVDGALMANDTFKGIELCAAFLTGWLLERRFVGFIVEVSVIARATRLASGLLSYYAVSLILVPLFKSWIPDAAGTTISCFIQMFYVFFLFLGVSSTWKSLPGNTAGNISSGSENTFVSQTQFMRLSPSCANYAWLMVFLRPPIDKPLKRKQFAFRCD